LSLRRYKNTNTDKKKVARGRSATIGLAGVNPVHGNTWSAFSKIPKKFAILWSQFKPVAENENPIANPGGPYVGTVGEPVQVWHTKEVPCRTHRAKPLASSAASLHIGPGAYLQILPLNTIASKSGRMHIHPKMEDIIDSWLQCTAHRHVHESLQVSMVTCDCILIHAIPHFTVHTNSAV